MANLDTYGGNSGSAVFNAKTGLVEGILVRGEQDYVQKGDCRVSNVCPADGCRGEDVTKILSVGFPAMDVDGRRARSLGAHRPGAGGLASGQRLGSVSAVKTREPRRGR